MSRRALFVGVIIVVIVGAIFAGNASASRPPAVPATDAAAAVPPSLGSSTVWFCPGLPPSIPAGDLRLTFSNIGTEPADIVATVLPDKGKPTQQTFTIAPSTVLTKQRDALGPPGALTTETFGGMVVVEEGVDGNAGTDMTPCATQTATDWHFAAGSTLRGVQMWLVVDDPYASDAKIDVTLRTSEGVRRPDDLQGLDVARHTRAVIAIHDYAVRDDRVAVEVHAEMGRVVAGQTIVYTSEAGTPGVATTVGTPAASDHWMFAGGEVVTGSSSWVAIVNDGTDDAQVSIQAFSANYKPVAPVTVAVGQDDVEWVQLGNCNAGATNCVPVPEGASYGLDVRADGGVPIVAQTLTRYSDQADVGGATTAIGVTEPVAKWAFATSFVYGERVSTLAFVNPFAQSVHVSVARVHDGNVGHPASFQSIAVPPGKRVSLSVVEDKTVKDGDAALLVDATGPIVVERTMVGADDVSRSPGIRLP
jgi:hypothetical protein